MSGIDGEDKAEEAATAEELVAQRVREAGERARAEADARRKRAGGRQAAPTEIGGRDGPNPVRYGDWEINGVASDF